MGKDNRGQQKPAKTARSDNWVLILEIQIGLVRHIIHFYAVIIPEKRNVLLSPLYQSWAGDIDDTGMYRIRFQNDI